MLDAIQPKTPILASQKPKAAKPKRSKFRLILALTMLALLAAGIFVGSKLVIFAGRILEGAGREFSFKRLFLSSDKTLIGEEQGEIRVLLLGIGGQNHEGGTLTDTIILLTLRLSRFKDEKDQVGIVSIPRDLVVNIPGYEFRKINNAYAFGEMNSQKQGPTLAKLAVETLLGVDIPYYAVVDFDGFKKVIDDLGGIEVDVETGFTDAFFPDSRFGYLPAVTFEAGRQKMDGERALQFARSRHGDNNQGSDFARSKRQQQLLKAIKEKLGKLNILTNLTLLNRTLDNLSDHLRTNLALHEMKRLYDLTRSLAQDEVHSIAIDAESGILCNQIVEETGAYILVPCQGLGNYEAVRNLVKNQFLIADLEKETPVVEIQGPAGSSAAVLEVRGLLNLPYLQINIGNFRASSVYQESIIYDNSGMSKPHTLKYLQDKLGFKVAQSPFPFPTTVQRPDFVIVAVQK